jgi:replicative DNA helicase
MVNNIEHEKQVLGAILQGDESLPELMDMLHEDMFSLSEYKSIFRVAKHLYDSGRQVSIISIMSHDKKIDLMLMTSLSSCISSSGGIMDCAKIVAQEFIRREIVALSITSSNRANQQDDVFDILQYVGSTASKLEQTINPSSIEHIAPIIALQSEKRAKVTGLQGLPTGFKEIDEVLGGWVAENLIIVAARPAMGKCLGKGTKVAMFDGTLKNVEDVVVGDQLMGDDSTPRNVLSLARGKEKMYWVRQNKGIDYRVNESHILSLKKSRVEGKGGRGSILNISVSDYMKTSPKFKTNYKGYKVAVEYAEQQLSLDPYFLGLWLGDGTTVNQNITNSDIEVIDYLESFGKSIGGNLKTTKYKDKAPTHRILNCKLQSQLRDMGLLGFKHIPKEYLVNSTENRLKLLAGLLDTDGYYDKAANVFEIVQTKEHLAKQIKYLCDTLGFKTNYKKKIATIKSIGFSGEVFRLQISGDLHLIPTLVERKKARVGTDKRDNKVTGIKVEYDKVDDYYGFEIDGNKLFLLEDMTVTHNTSLMLSFAYYVAQNQYAVDIYSMEMSKGQLSDNLVSMHSGVALWKIQRNKMDYEEQEKVKVAEMFIAGLPIYIDDQPRLKGRQLRSRINMGVKKRNTSLVLVDYIQIMGEEGKGNREQEIAQISGNLKAAAKESKIPVIALAQLSREVEKRADRRPQLSDLRESGAIEQDADVIMFPFRAWYYHTQGVAGFEVNEHGQSNENLGELLIAKHRHGMVADIPLGWDGSRKLFYDLKKVDDFEPKPYGKIYRPSEQDFMEF